MANPHKFTLHDLSPRLTMEHFMHALRTAVAAGLTLVVVRLLGFHYGYWAVISAIIVLQARIGASVNASWARVAGTAVGASTGALFGVLFGGGLVPVMVAVFICIMICLAVPWLRNSTRIAGLTVIIVMVAQHSGTTVPASALERFLEISLGIGCALFVSFFFFPARAARDAGLALSDALALDSTLLEAVYTGAFEPEYPEKVVRIVKGDATKTRMLVRKLVGEAKREPGGPRTESTVRLLELEERLFENILAMDHAARDLDPSGYRTNLSKPLDALKDAACENMEYLAALTRHRIKPMGSPPTGAPDLGAAMARVEQELQGLRDKRSSFSYPLNEMMNFFTFVHGLMEIARALNTRMQHPERAL